MSQQSCPQSAAAAVPCAPCIASCAHHTSSPIDAESICKSTLNPGREHFMGNMLGHSVIRAVKAKFHSPEVWWFPDGILGSSQPKQKSREIAGICQDQYLTYLYPPVLWLFLHRTKKGLKTFQPAVIFYRDQFEKSQICWTEKQNYSCTHHVGCFRSERFNITKKKVK